MKKLIILLITVWGISETGFAQCNYQTTKRPDGVTIDYFNPAPVVRQSEYEIGVSIYRNSSTNQLMLNISVLFKGMHPQKLNGNAVLQTTNTKGIKLSPIMSELIKMNGRDLAIGLYQITPQDVLELKQYRLKGLYVYLNQELSGSTVTENSYVLQPQINCLKTN